MNKLQCKKIKINKSFEGVEPLSKKTLHQTPPKFLNGLNRESKGEDNEKKRSWGALSTSQHLGVEGRVGVPDWDYRTSNKRVNYSHWLAQTKQ